MQQGFLEICIQAYCAAFVWGHLKLDGADFSLQTALMDFCSLCSCFNAVKVVKVARHKVKARAALLDLLFRFVIYLMILFVKEESLPLCLELEERSGNERKIWRNSPFFGS